MLLVLIFMKKNSMRSEIHINQTIDLASTGNPKAGRNLEKK